MPMEKTTSPEATLKTAISPLGSHREGLPYPTTTRLPSGEKAASPTLPNGWFRFLTKVPFVLQRATRSVAPLATTSELFGEKASAVITARVFVETRLRLAVGGSPHRHPAVTARVIVAAPCRQGLAIGRERDGLIGPTVGNAVAQLTRRPVPDLHGIRVQPGNQRDGFAAG